MKLLPLSKFIKEMRFRAASSSTFSMGRLKARGIFAWALAEVLALVECQDPFTA